MACCAGGAWIINARCRGTIPWEGACSRRGRLQPIQMHGSLHGLREQAPSHRLWVRRGLKVRPGLASGAGTRRICAGFRLSMHRPGPRGSCERVMARVGGYGLLRGGRMDNQRQMPWHYCVGGSLLAKGPVTADTHAWLTAWSSRASSLPQVMGSAWVTGLPGSRVRRKYTMHGLREQAPSHRLWVRRGLKACPGFASGANTQCMVFASKLPPTD
jgi:hypothetical protein